VTDTIERIRIFQFLQLQQSEQGEKYNKRKCFLESKNNNKQISLKGRTATSRRSSSGSDGQALALAYRHHHASQGIVVVNSNRHQSQGYCSGQQAGHARRRRQEGVTQTIRSETCRGGDGDH
jgi:hypothetical protein